MIDKKTYFFIEVFSKATINILTFQHPVSVEKVTSGKGGWGTEQGDLERTICALSHSLNGPTLVLFNWAPSVRAKNLLWADPPEICMYSLDHDLCTWDILPGVPTSRPRGSSGHAARPSIGRGGGGCKWRANYPHTTLSWCRTKKAKIEPGLPECHQGILSK